MFLTAKARNAQRNKNAVFSDPLLLSNTPITEDKLGVLGAFAF
jgi:hypothetical protein